MVEQNDIGPNCNRESSNSGFRANLVPNVEANCSVIFRANCNNSKKFKCRATNLGPPL